MKVLIQKEQNPRNRMVMQTQENMYVLSECCDGPIRDEITRKWVNKSGKYLHQKWNQCSSCMAWLQHNPRGYTAKIELIHYIDLGDCNWDSWAEFMLGLTDFKMEITS